MVSRIKRKNYGAGDEEPKHSDGKIAGMEQRTGDEDVLYPLDDVLDLPGNILICIYFRISILICNYT